jgi:hypothetical protein
MFLSSILKVVELIVVVVPLTVKFPAIVTVPDEFPMFSAVAAPPKLMVVAVVLSRSNDALPVVKLVVIAGDVPNTRAPEPVSSEITPASADDVVAANCPNVPVVSATSVIAPLLPLTVVTPVVEVRYVAVSTLQVPAPLVLRNPDVPVRAAIAERSASYA